jgi:hypothetical protein
MRSQVAGFMVRLARQLPLGLALCIGVAAQAQVGRPTAAKLPPGPELDAVAAQGYHQQFKPAPGQKAFAVSRDAKAYAAVIGREQSFEAVRGASVGCLAQFKTLCQIWLVNDEVVWPHYAKSRAASQAALKTLRQRAQQPFAEAVAAAASDATVPTQLRSGEQMHGSTPDAAPAGSRLIDTAGVVRLLTQARKPLLIDTLHGKSLIRSSLPTAHWLQGAGWEDPTLERPHRRPSAARNARADPEQVDAHRGVLLQRRLLVVLERGPASGPSRLPRGALVPRRRRCLEAGRSAHGGHAPERSSVVNAAARAGRGGHGSRVATRTLLCRAADPGCGQCAACNSSP